MGPPPISGWRAARDDVPSRGMRAVVPIAVLLAACSSPTTYVVVSPPRDWSAHPAIVDEPSASTLFAISDVHGGNDRLMALLAAAGVTRSVPATPGAIEWAAGPATLVIAGDLIDKGSQGLEVLDAAMALQASATASGGQVVVLLGNHEAEFFADPTNSKASASDGLDAELSTQRIDPVSIASGADARGRWLRDLPVGARIGSWFFAHAGNTAARSLGDLDRDVRTDIQANDYAGAETTGADSILESRDWFSARPDIGAREATALGVAHVVFGHSPHALGPDGAIAVAEHGTVFRIDCGMSPDVDYSTGVILRVRHDAVGEVAEAVGVTGAAVELWR